jgi:copper(I)-binding protein
MQIPSPRVRCALLLAAASAACAAPQPPCAPTLESAWIRAALPGSAMLAGYAVIRNACAVPMTITGAEGGDFAAVSIHATIDEGGVSRMRADGPLVLAPGTMLRLAPGGSHLMLSDPARPMPEGARAAISLVLADGRRVTGDFVVRRDAPASP